ncbi:hypothetical protein AALP_AA3G122000 [Arabis alpina]|uniref:Pentacotripeptide-repeat region of PRORP domain-containing protein n=1 Tax=Arabis alpina TaxID=50452 RepID=A0A087H8Q6_ARAAL|nr:hypothetical protein AALP_AA3G122000 [Arabis alpina]
MRKAESTFEKMRELGLISKPSPYKSMTSIYGSMVIRDKVNEILREMKKEKNFEVDSVTVNNALRVYDAVSEIPKMKFPLRTRLDMAKSYLRIGVKGKAREMLRRAEELRDPESYKELLKLYGEAGGKEDVYRIWDVYKNTSKVDNEGFRALIGSLLKLGDIRGAEEMYYKEWESSGLEFDVGIPKMLASGYREKGMVNKAGELMKKTIRNRELATPITSLLEEWGSQVELSDLRELIKNLSDSDQFSKALEASSWMCEKGVVNLFPEDYAARLHLIEKELGLEEAEKFFETSIPENMKDYTVYTTLLTSYTKSDSTLKKAESTFEKMRELGFLSKLSPFNSMISLYTEVRKRSKVNKLLLEMKEKHIEPDSVTKNNVLRVNAYVSAMESMEKCISEWVKDKKLKLDVETMDAMAEAYEREGLTPTKEVYRLWNSSRGRKQVEMFMKKTKRNIGLDRPITPLLEECGKRGNQLNQLNPSKLRDRIKNLSDSNQFSEALEASSLMFKKGVVNLFPEDYAARLHLIEKVFNLEEAEKFFERNIPENMKNYTVYSTILTSYTSSTKTVNKAEAAFEKMRELGFLFELSPFNSMIYLYTELRKRSKVNKLLLEMKEKNIEPDSVTKNNVLRVNAYVSAFESMEKHVSEWVKDDDDDDEKLKLDVETMDAMAEAYEREGLTPTNEVYRLWYSSRGQKQIGMLMKFVRFWNGPVV